MGDGDPDGGSTTKASSLPSLPPTHM